MVKQTSIWFHVLYRSFVMSMHENTAPVPAYCLTTTDTIECILNLNDTQVWHFMSVVSSSCISLFLLLQWNISLHLLCRLGDIWPRLSRAVYHKRSGCSWLFGRHEPWLWRSSVEVWVEGALELRYLKQTAQLPQISWTVSEAWVNYGRFANWLRS